MGLDDIIPEVALMENDKLDIRLSAVEFESKNHALVSFMLRTNVGRGIAVVATLKQRVTAYQNDSEQYNYSQIVSEAGRKLHAEFMEMAKYLHAVR